MGCKQSKIESEESVARCKDRKRFMKSAVTSRNAFAAAHFSYAMALKNIGAALSDFAEAEVHELRPAPTVSSASSAPANSSVGNGNSAIKPPIDSLPPPPPRPEHYSTIVPLLRAASLPGFPLLKDRWKNSEHESAIVEEEVQETMVDESVVDEIVATPVKPPAPPKPSEEKSESKISQQNMEENWDILNLFNTEHTPAPSLVQQDESAIEKGGGKVVEVEISHVSAGKDFVHGVADVGESVPPTQQQKMGKKQRSSGGSSHHHRTGSAGGGSESKRGKMVAAMPQSFNFLKILKELDDHFLDAHASGNEVSKMLEATRLHYHSNFADNRGHIDHSEKVLKVITWNRSIKGIRSDVDAKDDLDDEKWETHATVLDKMLAWEKKLYDEVKAAELMKFEYQRKVHLLNKQKKHVVENESLEKLTAAVSQLHTRFIVDIQSMESTISEINNLRDHKLYPRLVELVDGMSDMWESMHSHHSNQQKLVAGLRAFEISVALRETSEQHHGTTVELKKIVEEWHSRFQNLVTHQKEYIKALNSWLKLNIIPIESSLQKKLSPPPSRIKPPIQDLLQAWHYHLEKLKDGSAKTAIYSFSEAINDIVMLQEDELKLRERCEETRKEFFRKKRSFEDWHRRYVEKKNENAGGDEANQKDLVERKKFDLESLEVRLKSEEEAYQKTCKQVREVSVGKLRSRLPELFHAMAEFSLACSEMYQQLRTVAHQSERPELAASG